MNREFIPGVYRHFKDDKPLNERFYYGIAETVPNIENALGDYDPGDVKIIKIFKAKHTETGEIVQVLLCEDGHFVTDKKESLIFYKALYGKGECFLRPKEMFLSLVDKDKYPQYSQEDRLEKIEGGKLL